jgi:hypothetical protein
LNVDVWIEKGGWGKTGRREDGKTGRREGGKERLTTLREATCIKYLHTYASYVRTYLILVGQGRARRGKLLWAAIPTYTNYIPTYCSTDGYVYYSTDMSDVWGGSSLSREEGSAGGICDDLDSGKMMMTMMMMIDQVQAYKL